MQRMLLIVVAALALAVAGCGSDDDGGSTSTTAPAATTDAAATGGAKAGAGAGETVTVEMVNIQFSPKDLEIAVGDTVRWVNLDTVDHDAVSTSGDEFESELFGKGGSYEWTAEAPAEIDYECTLHPGMVGTITVR